MGEQRCGVSAVAARWRWRAPRCVGGISLLVYEIIPALRRSSENRARQDSKASVY